VLDICDHDDDVPLFTEETFAPSSRQPPTTQRKPTVPDTEAAVGGGDCADFSLD
jgi:hypothetical protein